MRLTLNVVVVQLHFGGQKTTAQVLTANVGGRLDRIVLVLAQHDRVEGVKGAISLAKLALQHAQAVDGGEVQLRRQWRQLQWLRSGTLQGRLIRV